MPIRRTPNAFALCCSSSAAKATVKGGKASVREAEKRLSTAHAGFMGTQPLFNGTTIDYHGMSQHGKLSISQHGKLSENLDKLSQLEDKSMKTLAHLMKSLTESDAKSLTESDASATGIGM